MADTEVIGDTTEKMSTDDISSEETPMEGITEEETQPSKTVKEELVNEVTEELNPDSVVKETVDENGDVFEETTQVTRKVVKRTMKITETSSSTKTTTMTTPAKLYGKDLSEYDEVDVDALLAQLSPEEINILAKEVDPDDNFLPPNQRCSYECTKDPTGPLDRKKLIEHINKEALETPDLPELEPYVKGTVRGKKWVPPPRDEREIAADEQIAIDLGDEYEHALTDATQEEIIDLAAILGFHSMMNQDQYHASLLNKGQPVGLGWDGITKSTTQKLYPIDPPNNTDVEESIKRVKDDDPKLIELNLNNIKNISDEKFEQLFDVLPQNEHLEVLSLTNVGLTDKTALLLAEAIEKSKTLRVLNVETNFINPPVIVTLVKSLLKARTIEEFRASNQRSTVLGNKIEMEITDLVEKNTSLLRLGLHLEFNDARHRVAAHLQRNIDRNEHEFRKGTSSSPIPNATSIKTSAAGTVDDLLSLQKTIQAKSPKPMHIVLTPQERIDSKSELIASLVSQKLSDRGRGEVSLAVPQIGGSRSPSPKERKSPTKEVIPKVKVEVKPLEKKVEKQVSPSRSPTRHPKIGELRHSTLSKAVDEISTSLQENGGTPELIKIQEEVTVDKTLKKSPETERQAPGIKVSDEKIDKNPLLQTAIKTSDDLLDKKVDNSTTLESLKTEKEASRFNDSIRPKKVGAIVTVRNSDERERLSESVSPSRHLEDNMALLRAKIDSFAEVADEKLSSLRSKFDGLARDTSLAESIDSAKVLSKNTKPKLDEPIARIEPIVTVPESIDPKTLPPKVPSKAANISKVVPTKPLIKTQNSVGITLLYQKILPKTEPQASPISDKLPDSVETSKQLSVTDVEIPNETLKNAFQPISPIIASETSGKITDQGTEKVAQISKPKPEPDSVKLLENPKPEESETTLDEPTPNPDSMKAMDRKKPESNAISDDITPNPVSETKNPQVTKVGSETTALSLLSVKKGERIEIEPTKTVDAETQSPAKPSPLSRLSIQKRDPQKIDPIQKTEVGTQSPAKPNPLSRLSVKSGDLVNISPIKKSEVSTQVCLEEPKAEASSQTVDEEPIKTLEDSTQTPLVFSSLEHDYIFPGLRRVPYFPRPKTINIGGGDRVVIKPSSKPINEVLMLLYPVIHDHRTVKPLAEQTSGKNFGLEEDLVKDGVPDSTIKDLEEAMQKATEVSSSILKAAPKASEDPIKSEEEVTTSMKTEIEIPLSGEVKPESPDNLTDDRANISTEARYEKKFTAVEKVEALSRTTIESEAHVKVIDKAYKSVAEVSTSEEERVSKTSIRSANMWQSLSSNLIKASEQTLIDISKAADLSETVSSTRTKVGKISVYSSIEDLSHSSRSKYSDRHIGGLIKTVEKTSVYSSTEDLPLLSYTKYSDRYGDGHVKTVTSVYSSTEDLPQSSRTKYSDHYAGDLAKASVYSSTEDLSEISYTKYSDRYADAKVVGNTSHHSAEATTSDYKSIDDFTLLPRSKFSDRYKDDYDVHRSQPKFPVSHDLSKTSIKTGKSYYKSILDDHSISRSQYKSTEDRIKINDRTAHEITKSYDSSLQTAVLSSISRNQSALRPYTYVPTSIYTDLAIDHVRPRPSSPTAVHTSTLQLNISPAGISELPPTRPLRHISKNTIDKPQIVITRSRDENKSIRGLSPIERSRPSSNLLSPHRKVSDQAKDDFTDESSQSMLDISSASAAEYNASTTITTTMTPTPTTTPKKRANIMDTIKMLKNRVRDVITTEDRFSETHRLPSYSSSTPVTSRAARPSARATSSSLKIQHDSDEKEI